MMFLLWRAGQGSDYGAAPGVIALKSKRADQEIGPL